MKRNFSRRKFLVYGSATLGTSLLLKACSSNQSTACSPFAQTEEAEVLIDFPRQG